MNLEKRKEIYRSKFVLGTQYYRQPTPTRKEWKNDLAKIRDIGMEFIQLRPQWRWHERQEGKYYWDDIDCLIDLAEEASLKVIFKFMLETAPDYIYRKYNGYRTGMKNEIIWPYSHGAFFPGGWLPCFDNPDVMAGAKRFIQNAVERYQNKNVLCLWHAWNEPRSRPMGECTCPHSLESYHSWLKEKFDSVDQLNEFLGKSWGRFEDIDVPRDTADFAEMYLWRQWAASRVAWRVAEVKKTIQEADPTREVISHVGFPSVLQDVMDDTSDDYLTRKSVDFYGCSFEIRYTPYPLDQSWPFLIADWIRSVSGDGYYWVNELYPSRGKWEPEVPPDIVAGWHWKALACGAKGILLWQFKKERVGCETNDAGLVEMDGRENPTCVEVRKVYDVIGKNESLFRSARVPKAKIALVYDFNSDMVSRIEESKHMGDLSPKNNLPAGYTYKTALQGAYHLFWLAGIQVDLLSSHELERISEYEMIYLPSMFIVSERQAKLLKDYVAQGGKLLAEGGTAQRDTNTWVHTTRPGVGLTELFGVMETERVVDKETIRGVNLPTGMDAVSGFMNASFELQGANTLASYDNGDPAIVENAFGKGKVMMTGFSPGLAFLLEPNQAWPEWIFHTTSAWAGLSINDTPEEIYTRRLATEDKQISFIFNRGSQGFSLPMTNSASELISGKKYARGENAIIPPGQTVILVEELSTEQVRKNV